MKKEPKVRLNLMIAPSDMERLNEVARRDGLNRSIHVRRAISRYLDFEKARDPNEPSS